MRVCMSLRSMRAPIVSVAGSDEEKHKTHQRGGNKHVCVTRNAARISHPPGTIHVHPGLKEQKLPHEDIGKNLSVQMGLAGLEHLGATILPSSKARCCCFRGTRRRKERSTWGDQRQGCMGGRRSKLIPI